MQVLCGLQGIFLLFNCQTPELSLRAGEVPTFVLNLENTKKKQRLGKIESCIGALNGLIMR